MVKSENIVLIKYEFVTYIDIEVNESAHKVSNILLTSDDIENILPGNNEAKWLQANKIDIIDVDNIDKNYTVESKKKICGLFETGPLNWKYAKIMVKDNTNTIIEAIAKMPRSPIIPVIFEVKH